MICCFTGHRTIEKDRAAALSAALDRCIADLYAGGYTEFRTGGARGFDTLAALRVLRLKQEHPDCRLVLILPCRDQPRGWSRGERALWERILAEADEHRFVEESYTPACMHLRNRALVEGSDCCVAYLRENRGGTLYTCSYALKLGLRFINLVETIERR